jgi:hypothetical protein
VTVNGLVFFKRFLDIIEDEVSQAQSKVVEYFSNPINAYLFIKHLTVEWYQIKNMAPSGTITESIFIF